MNTTVILYVSLLFGLTVAFFALLRRDRQAAREERDRLREASEPAFCRLPTLVDETKPLGLTDRIDHGLQLLMYQTGLDIGAEPAFLLMVLVGLVIGGSLFVWRDDPIQGAIGMVGGMAIPLMVFNYLRNQRLKQIREQLPDCMDLMAAPCAPAKVWTRPSTRSASSRILHWVSSFNAADGIWKWDWP